MPELVVEQSKIIDSMLSPDFVDDISPITLEELRREFVYRCSILDGFLDFHRQRKLKLNGL